MGQLYVLVTDPRMPSKANLWGTQEAHNSEEAQTLFRNKIERWYHSPDTTNHHFQLMDADRERRVRENDFAVELN